MNISTRTLILLILILLITIVCIWLILAPEQSDTFVQNPTAPEDVVVNQQEINTIFPDTTIMSGSVRLDVNQFLNDGSTLSDPENVGEYILTGNLGYCVTEEYCPDNSVSESFMVTFHADGNYFNILLLTQPIQESRSEAEQYLLRKLNLSQTQLCQIDYTMTAPDWLGSPYSGQRLEFSFCPGAPEVL